MKQKQFAGLAFSAALVSAAALVAVPAQADQSDKAPNAGNAFKNRYASVSMLSFNDFHGHLEATDPPLAKTLDPSQTPVGGSEYLAAKLTELRGGSDNTVTVAAGDLIGGSTFLSGAFHDEPAIESMDALGLDVSSVGNHEFDEGTDELLRIQNGGCHWKDGCYFPDQPYEGADFQYLAANTVVKDTGDTLLPGTFVKKIDGVNVGFIGMTLKATPTLVNPAGVASVEFTDEIETANKSAAALQAKGVESIVVLIHEGGYQAGTYNDCVGISGPIVDIATTVSPAIDAVVSGHTHQPYTCTVTDPAGNPRSVTSAADYGRVVTKTDLKIDRKTKDVVREETTAVNHLVDRNNAPDAAQTAILAKWSALAGPIRSKVVGTVAEDITGDSSGNRGIETPMADVVADSILAGTSGDKGGAQIAFMNVGGVRSSFLVNQISNGEQPGEITYDEAYKVAPFGNMLVSMDLTGADIDAILEEQYQPVPARGSRPTLAMGVSEGFTYTWDATQPQGSRASNLALNGVALDAAATYRVGTLNFLAEGGDLFTSFKKGTNVLGGADDLANLVDYLGANPGLTAPASRVDGL
ncbi:MULTISPECIES: bifunctional metallophosphatase/5'-nucleotidase [unclassified Janibacter]|uniref:bifunctional metallophosphatase/5'-nucleotidase n=1 Tax=unclassified Janibacter TaxID=2649294 RepID=UPI003CFC821D